MKWLFLVLIGLSSSNAIAFSNFDAESKRVTSNIGCLKPKVMPPAFGMGKLYTCVTGSAETVKFFINEVNGTNKVKNAKFMWNDYKKNIGYGIHADKRIAMAWAASIATMYAPLQVEEVMNAINSNTNKVIKNKIYTLKYTYTSGPVIDERLILITMNN